MSLTTTSSNRLRLAALPDSFKGSTTAQEAAEAMVRGAKRAAASFGVELDAQSLPFADGGEGTLDAICSAWGVTPYTVAVTDALGRPAQARYAVSPDRRTGLIEAAEANGLPRVSDEPLQPRRASTRGVGDLVAAVLDQGCEEILLCIGGSATTDGGAGLIQRLGARLLDAGGQELDAGGGALKDLASIDQAGLDPRVQRVRWRIACDVTNPLLGPEGAAAVFGPQKGADEHDVEALDAALARFADVLAEETGKDIRDEPGMGAAGGIPAALVSLFDAEIVPGGVLVAETLGAYEILAGADVVLTGEGRLDAQSLGGKVVDTIRRITPERTPVYVLAGSVDVSAEEIEASGITAAFSIAPGPKPLEELSATAQEYLEFTAEQVLRTHLAAQRAQRHVRVSITRSKEAAS